MKRFIAGLVLFMLSVTLPKLQAQDIHAPNIKHQQRLDQRRIHHGVATGQLTHRKARHLHMEQAKIEHYKQMAKADGRVSRRERALIRSEQAKLGRDIYCQKHDGQHRYRRF